MTKTNYNHLHRASGTMISGSPDGYLTVKDIRDAIAELPDDAEVIFGTCGHGEPLQFGRFKMRGQNLLQIEFN
ncbi:hypothetical protein ACQKGC_05245 [Allorhizobium pseudoryzae]|uniref:hypothetical protein n=1 Tax=Allorhizobium pseudoryzae TaxID=379684 RepID=UPI003D049805